MRQSSVVKEIIRKESVQYIISNIEVRFGEVDDAIKKCLESIQDEETLKYLHRQSAIAAKDDIEKRIIALSKVA